MVLQLDDLSLYYDDLGAGIPLLCLPPFPFDHRIWREQASLADAARLLMPDLRGVGRSTVTPGPFTMELHADDMLRLLDALGIERAVVMGVSMGAYVAFALYRRAADRFRGLILADTRAEADTPEQAARRRRTVDGLRTQGAAMLRDRVNDLFAAVTRTEQPALVEEYQAIAAGMNPEGLAQTTLGMALRPDCLALLPEIATPTLVLCGEQDTVSPPDGMRRLAAAVPGARFALIPRAGHLAPLEHPGVFNHAVRAFLASLP